MKSRFWDRDGDGRTVEGVKWIHVELQGRIRRISGGGSLELVVNVAVHVILVGPAAFQGRVVFAVLLNYGVKIMGIIAFKSQANHNLKFCYIW